MRPKYNVTDWLNGSLDGKLPHLGGSIPGQEPYVLYAFGGMDEMIYREIRTLQEEAFYKAVEMNVHTAIKLFKQSYWKAAKSEREAFLKREINFRNERINLFPKQVKDRYAIGEFSVIGIDSKLYTRIIKLHKKFTTSSQVGISLFYIDRSTPTFRRVDNYDFNFRIEKLVFSVIENFSPDERGFHKENEHLICTKWHEIRKFTTSDNQADIQFQDYYSKEFGGIKISKSTIQRATGRQNQ